MTDYIKRENAKRAVLGCVRDTGIDEAPFEYAESLLEDVPSEDVAPVVRCKDCVHCEKETMTCTIFIKNRLGDDFCSEGER